MKPTYTLDQFESVPARELIQDSQRWLSDGRPDKRYGIFSIYQVYSSPDDKGQPAIHVIYIVRDGNIYDTETSTIDAVDLDNRRALIRLVVPHDRQLLVLKREFEPQEEGE